MRKTGKIQERWLWQLDPMMVLVVEGIDVVNIDLIHRRGRKFLLITCQSYFTILDKEKEERKSDLTK